MGTKERGFTAKDICEIVKAVSESRIQVLEYRGLKISTVSPEFVPTPTSSEMIPVSVEDLVTLESEAESEEAQLELLKLENPEEYERRLLTGEIVDEDAEDS